jgi:hypothetical protein
LHARNVIPLIYLRVVGDGAGKLAVRADEVGDLEGEIGGELPRRPGTPVPWEPFCDDSSGAAEAAA